MQVNNEKYVTQIAKDCGIESSNCCTSCKKLIYKGLIYFRRVKHKKYVMLTEEGETTKELLIKLENPMR